ncbi:MAG: MATE family efflux transporter [Eubacteriales bacterium]|nr:MATE family efflux transporter [Eubacteriales bacterium]MDD4323526.1 MATE family efflux transporter [Eubacteriales bacterium]MDD4541372.1 MATE family efflux transporter [Eubacteriales bacterium]
MRIRNVALTEGTIWKKLLIFALPLMLSNFLQQLYNTADLLIVGRFAGTHAQAAVGATGNLANMLVGFFVGLSTGCAVVVAQMYGAEDEDGLYRMVHSAISIALLSGVILSVAGYFLSTPLLRLMNTPEEILADSSSYLRIFFAGAIPSLLYNMGAGILRSVGDSKRPFYFLAVSSITNIILDLLFIAVLGWGVQGAAWATVISQVLAAVLVLVSLTRSETSYRLYLRDIAFHGEVGKRALTIGVPAGLQSVLISGSNVIIQTAVNGFGTAAVAGYASAGRLDGFVWVALNAIALAMMTFMGQNIGAGKFERAKQGLKQALILVVIVAGSLCAVFLLFSKPLALLFNPDPEVTYYTMRVMLFILTLYWLFGINEVIGGALRGVGRSMVPMLVTLTCMSAFRVFWIYVIMPLNPTFDMMLLAYPLSWVLTFIVYFIYMKKVDWLPIPKDTEKAEEMENIEANA